MSAWRGSIQSVRTLAAGGEALTMHVKWDIDQGQAVRREEINELGAYSCSGSGVRQSGDGSHDRGGILEETGAGKKLG
ncbi:hypothetical protein BaRGS_00018444 [Batillaria attramentaria]|uniref:Ig-like domain-containing protein n=1 Tax=Batillaria attramentaria TaxID=370345 RepID=A0ABD0KSN8_9CAEN